MKTVLRGRKSALLSLQESFVIERFFKIYAGGKDKEKISFLKGAKTFGISSIKQRISFFPKRLCKN